MGDRKPKIWKEYLGSLYIALIIAFAFYFFIPIPGAPSKEQLSWWVGLLNPLISGLVFGSFFFVIGLVTGRLHLRSFWLTCLVRTLIIIATLLLGMAVVIPIFAAMANHSVPWNLDLLRGIWEFLPTIQLPKWIAIAVGLSFAINALYQINRKLGPGILWNWMTGKYHEPREEERLFMFLDLKNSTTLAEKLGNIRFSKLVQDFFHDLTNPVVETGGQVSHYIGDEAVLTWKPKKGLERANCIRCFVLMDEAIQERSERYRTRYGIVPEFKAGLHIGAVVAAEVGDVKSEIVYHGDVLNTTARITGLCSEMKSDLLISGDLAKRLVFPAELAALSLGEHFLKGKEHAVEIVAIRKQTEQAPIERQEQAVVP